MAKGCVVDEVIVSQILLKNKIHRLFLNGVDKIKDNNCMFIWLNLYIHPL
jgi:hypothetical protein